MTTVPGNNIFIQQSGATQELIYQINTSKPSPKQVAAQQQANELAQGTIVQEDPDSSGRLLDITA